MERNVIRNVSSLEEVATDNISDEDIMTAMQEYELVTKITPIRKYKIKAKVRSIKKASLQVIEPEGLDGEDISLV